MKNQDKPSFPCTIKSTETYRGSQYVSHGGLTKREHLAGLAMQAIISNTDGLGYYGDKEVAENAVAYADALLKELEKPQP